jgi:putative FmdB family regulatory protein
MRFFEYKCHFCGHTEDEYRETDKRDEPGFCDNCNEQSMDRVVVTSFHGVVKNPAVPRGKG